LDTLVTTPCSSGGETRVHLHHPFSSGDPGRLPRKKPQGKVRAMPFYVYLIQIGDVYKVGRTEVFEGLNFTRLKSYPPNSTLISLRQVCDKYTENTIIHQFNSNFEKVGTTSEYFRGDVNKMVDIMNDIIKMERYPPPPEPNYEDEFKDVLFSHFENTTKEEYVQASDVFTIFGETGMSRQMVGRYMTKIGYSIHYKQNGKQYVSIYRGLKSLNKGPQVP
jgi:hypothetical protein